MARRHLQLNSVSSSKDISGIRDKFAKVSTAFIATTLYREDLGDLTVDDVESALSMKPRPDALGVCYRLAEGVADVVGKRRVPVMILGGIAPCELWILRRRPENELQRERLETIQISEGIAASLARERERQGKKKEDGQKVSLRNTLPVYAKDIIALAASGLEVRDITKKYRRDKKLQLGAGQVRYLLEGKSQRGYVRAKIIKD